MQHCSIQPNHYDQESENYDAFNEQNSTVINNTIAKYLQSVGVHSVLDLTCGTGSQCFYLQPMGFRVVGVDINQKMLAIAEQKNAAAAHAVSFQLGDMRSSVMGAFDAVITIFNSIGHLTEGDFLLTLDNIRQNLKPNGYYIFDNFNLEYLLYKDNITKLTIDNQIRKAGVLAREIQYSTINQAGVLASYDIYHQQEQGKAPVVSHAYQTLQTYTIDKLQLLLQQHGFVLQQVTNVDGSPFHQMRSERMLVVAQKIK